MLWADDILEMSCKNTPQTGYYCIDGFCSAALFSQSLTPEGASGLKVIHIQ